jgi:hypothetical protein
MSNNEIIDTPATEVVYDPEKVYATIVLRDDGFHVIDEDGTEGPVCKLCDAEDKTIALTKNASNRQWFNRAKAEAEIAEKGFCELYYKATKKLGAVSRNNLPNAKLISYLSEELQAEYKAIIDRAIAAREADRKKPMTELEKAQARLEKAKAALAKLEAENADLVD